VTSQTITVLGLVAGTLTTVAFIPQLLLVLRTRRTQDISLGMFLIFSSGVALWLVYGLLLGDVPVVLANGVTLVLALVILYYKLTLK
jgi:MtN3 and saliva related transmembrane protein